MKINLVLQTNVERWLSLPSNTETITASHITAFV